MLKFFVLLFNLGAVIYLWVCLKTWMPPSSAAAVTSWLCGFLSGYFVIECANVLRFVKHG